MFWLCKDVDSYDNGRGKSNILEAISYLSLGKSVRGAKDSQVIPHTGSYFDVRGVFSKGNTKKTIRIFYGKQEGKKVFGKRGFT